MLYDNYKKKILQRAAMIKRILRFMPVILAAFVVMFATVLAFAIAKGTVIDVTFTNHVEYGNVPDCKATAFLGDAYFEYRLKGEKSWGAEAPKLPGEYEVRVTSDGMFGKRHKYIDVLHVYPRCIDIVLEGGAVVYGEMPKATANLSAGDRIVCENFIYESKVLSDTRIKADSAAVKIYNAAGEDITYAYEIDTPYSDVTISKKELVIYIADAVHEYDGKEFSYKEYELAEGSLMPGESLQAKFEQTITDVGSVINKPVITVVNSDGVDVSHLYQISEKKVGHLIVTKRPLHILTGSATFEFDGEEKQCLEYKISGNTALVEGHEIVVNGAASATFVGMSSNTMSFSVLDANGNDVTDNYSIVVTTGTIEITKRPITVTTGSASWEYDGIVHSSREYKVDGLVFGNVSDNIRNLTYITTAGKAENVFEISIYSGTSDITDNYEINYVYGTLEVTKRPIKIKTASAVWEYDGESHSTTAAINSRYEVISGSLAANDRAEYEMEFTSDNSINIVSITNAGSIENTTTLRIKNGIDDVTGSYDITYEYGTLTVRPRAITVTPVEVSKVYDGTPLSATEINVSGNAGGLAKDTHILEYTVSGSRTNVNDTDVSKLEGVKITEDGKDITNNYEITLVDGIISILPRTLYVGSGSAEKLYDGTPLTNSELFIMEGSPYTLVEGHRMVGTPTGSQTEIGESANVFNTGDIKFYAGDADVTENYLIDAVNYGVLEVTKYIAKISIVPDIATKVYDGTPLTCDTYTVSITFGELLEGHEVSATITSSITDAGTIPNVIERAAVTDAEGNDVSYMYEITLGEGVLSVLPRSISLASGSAEKFYDGTPLTNSEIMMMAYSEYDLLEGHRLVGTAIGSQTEVGESENIFFAEDIRIYAGESDVTHNYTISETQFGTLEVYQYLAGINIVPDIATKAYDGTPLTCGTYNVSVTYGEIMEGHSVHVTITSSITDVGTIPNTVESAVVLDADGNDVSYMYELIFGEGILSVLARNITVESGSAEKFYDGTPLTNEHIFVSQNSQYGLLEGHYLVGTANGTQTEVGESDNIFNVDEIRIYEGETDVTENYSIEARYGILEVLQYIAGIEITSDSAEKEYDGTPLTCDTFSVFTKYGELAEGHRVVATMTGSLTEVGIAPNTIGSVVVLDAEGNDVSYMYEISTSEGRLTVREYVDKETVFMKLKAEKTGLIYLKMKSYGDYNLRGFNEATPYTTLIDDKYNASYFTPIALMNAGYTSSNIEITEAIIYMLPYYAGTNGTYNVPGDDVNVNGTYSDSAYNVPYFTIDSYENKLAHLLGNLGEYEAAEQEYRTFVYNNYTALDSETAAFMQNIIAENGFDVNNGNIISDVAKYIQNAAVYSLDYDLALDSESNVAIAFLSTYKQGICRHYATAATLLYRALGIPARYVEGFAVDAQAGNIVDVRNPGHAWVEIYIDGLGWVQVEVTGGFINEEVKQEIVVQPTYQYKQDDGTPLYATNQIIVSDVLSNLIANGYTYDVSVSGSQESVGKGVSTVTYFALYDAQGNDVTDDFIITFVEGELEILAADKKLITVYLYETSKVYDGTPIIIGDYDYEIIDGGDGIELDIDFVKNIVNAGKVYLTDINGSIDEYIKYTVTRNGEDVTSEYELRFDVFSDMNAGTYVPIEIIKRKITLTASSAEKVYDGKALMSEAVTMTFGTLASGDKLTASASGAITSVGSVENIVSNYTILNAAGEDVTNNYYVETIDGKLDVIEKK